MARTEITLSGDKALDRQFAALGDAARGEALLGALVSGALLMSNDAKAKAPVKTGNLRRSIHVGDEASGPDWAECAVGTNVEYAPFVELGTSKMAARPFLRPAAESTRADVRREIVGALRAQLRRAV